MSTALGEILKAKRAAKGLSQEEVSKRIQKSLRTYQYYEDGKVEPKGEILIKLSEELEFDIADIYKRNDARNKLHAASNEVEPGYYNEAKKVLKSEGKKDADLLTMYRQQMEFQSQQMELQRRLLEELTEIREELSDLKVSLGKRPATGQQRPLEDPPPFEALTERLEHKNVSVHPFENLNQKKKKEENQNHGKSHEGGS